MERQRQMEIRQREDDPRDSAPLTEEQKQAAAKKEFDELLSKRSGGVYIPPARLRALQAQTTDKSSKEFQRMAWEALKKSINGLINKVNIGNIKHIVPELFGENLVRGRGLFARSIMKAQSVSLPFTPIFAATTAIVNTKLPQVGELLVKRLVVQFRKAFKRNDKSVCLSSTTFIAQLVNQQVVDEMLAAQILLLLLHKPTDDSVEIAVNLVKECGQHLEEMNGSIALAVFDQFRTILHEHTDLEKRTQYMIEVLFQIRRDKYKEYPAVKEELDLVEEEDQITHKVDLDEEIATEDALNIFKFDPEYEAHEEAYKKLKAEILGEADDDDSDAETASSDSEDEEAEADKQIDIRDQTNTNLVNLRRSIYLTIKSSGGFEEAVHKLMRINLPAGLEHELPSMIIECASQERTYEKFYGLIAERFCLLNRLWKELFQEAFIKYYETIHRYETNRLRIIAQLFGHLLSVECVDWQVLQTIRLNEEETTSASRIFIKILFEDMVQQMGGKTLKTKFQQDSLQPYLDGVFPKDDPRNTRFSINFFTAIGMGMLTEGMREWLNNLPKEEPAAVVTREPDTDSDSESVSSYSSYSSRSRSPTPRRITKSNGRTSDKQNRRTTSDSRSRSRSPYMSRSRSPDDRRRHRSYSRDSRDGRSNRRRDSRSRSDSRRWSYSRSPEPARKNGTARRRDSRSPSYSVSRSPTPDRRRRRNSSSPPPNRRQSFTPPPPRRRRNSSSVERSPSPVRSRGGRR